MRSEENVKHKMDIDSMGFRFGSNGGTDDQAMTDITPPAASSVHQPFPDQPSTPGQLNANPTETGKKRSGPPSFIPNFPGNMTPRDPPPFFNSPNISPPPQSTSQSPMSSPPTRGTLRMPPQPFALPDSATPASPWLQLAAASGAPTPSLESGPGRSSPHLGYPFERLNIGGSWSGGNLWGEGAQRRGSVDSNPDEGPQAGSSPSRSGSGGVNQDALAKYRMMAGKASASGPANKQDVSSSSSSTPTISLPPPSGSKPPLPAALAKRRASLPKNVLGGLGVLSPPIVTGSKAPSPLATSTSSPTLSGGLKPLAANALQSLIDKTSTLILDLRPPSAFQSSHLPSSHSIPVPSTLLRRPAFTLGKLMQMLSPQGSEAVSQWENKLDIVLVDADTTQLATGGILEGVAGKFQREGFSGNMWFVKGGTAAAAAQQLPFVSDQDGEVDASKKPARPGAGLRIGSLGKLAFQQESTGSNLQNRIETPGVAQTPGSGIRNDPFAALATSTRTEKPGPLPNFGNLINASGDQRRSSALSGSSNSGSQASSQKPKVQPANPFFDNIRQNLELSHGGGHERISLDLPQHVTDRASELPSWLSELATMPDTASAERLAEEFYQVEVGEQKRLQAVMNWHSNSSGGVVVADPEDQNRLDAKVNAKLTSWTSGHGEDEDYFPYSISAGVERGAKNRYKNIWPYDYSRVRLHSPPGEEGDYINASFIQPRGTARRYIATQGPLDATYQDFWTLIWEQSVSVIVMLTKQYEGGSIKCGNYWKDEHYGPLHVKLETQTGGEDTKPEGATGFDFGIAAQQETKHDAAPVNIIRTFSLSRDDKNESPRRVVQIQCTSWPDFDVPDTPEILLNLMHDVDTASRQTCTAVDVDDRADHPPVLVHCSAGIGRTGTYIVVDAIIDALRQERERAFAVTSSRERSTSATPSLLYTSLPPLSSSVTVLPNLDQAMDVSRRESDSDGSGSPVSASARSGDSGKAASFLVPPGGAAQRGSTDSLRSVFTSSPSPMAYKSSPISGINGPPSTEPTSISSSYSNSAAVDDSEQAAEKMDVDPKPELPVPQREESEDSKRKTMFNNLFTKHRGGSSVTSMDSDMPGPVGARFDRRPSLADVSDSANESTELDKLSQGALDRRIGRPTPITKSSERHRAPSPVTDSEGLSPVAVVLEGMRMQRMSLVQSLRQYLFVHRAIVQSYLDMVDEDKRNGRELSIQVPGYNQVDRPPLHSARSGYTSISTDEEGHFKRRASPTELLPELQAVRSHGASLSKRASFKKMRPAVGLDNMSISEEESKGGGRPRRQSKTKLGREKV